MRNPKTMLLLTVIVCVLLLGVAYAAIQNVTLTVTGNVIASPDQGNFDVHFTGTPITEGTGTVEVAILNGLEATMNVSGLKKVGDQMAIGFEIINQSNGLDAILHTEMTQKNSEYFRVEYEVTDARIQENETEMLAIMVTLIKVPISEDVEDNITVKLTAVPYNPGEGEVPEGEVPEEEVDCPHTAKHMDTCIYNGNGTHTEVYRCDDCGTTVLGDTKECSGNPCDLCEGERIS